MKAPVKYLSVMEAAEYLSISKGFVRKLCQNGELPHYKIGERTVINPADLDKFMSRRRIS